jgi:hypothetical protein
MITLFQQTKKNKRYEKMCESTRAFVITQWGLSCFERVDGGGGKSADGEWPAEYAARTFNFWVFPQPLPPALAALAPESVANRRFACEAGSLAFLAEQGFDFKCVCARRLFSWLLPGCFFTGGPK